MLVSFSLRVPRNLIAYHQILMLACHEDVSLNVTRESSAPPRAGRTLGNARTAGIN